MQNFLDLSELNHRANMRVKKIRDKQVVIYEDHRYLLNVLYHAIESKQIEAPIALFRFDMHYDDLTPTKEARAQLKEFKAHLPSMEKFWSFTEFHLKHDDDDWLRAAYDLGWVSNNLLFQVEQGDYISQPHLSPDNTKHHTINLGDIQDLFIAKDEIQHSSLLQVCGWNGHAFIPEYRAFILDIDLDAFSVLIGDDIKAVSEETFVAWLSIKNEKGISVHAFLQGIFERALFTTICMESLYCGGMSEAFQILKLLDQYIFDQKLMTY
jgi:UPF0489 domain